MKRIILLFAILGLVSCADYTPQKLTNGQDAKLQIISIDGQKPIEYSPMFYDVIEGSPKHSIWKQETADGNISTGVWQSTKGKWKFHNTHWEYCRIRSGISIITEDGGEPKTVKAGDSFVLREGFRGTWEVIETTQKDYVIRK